MQAQRQRDTAPELAVRRAVWRLGLRYYVDRRPLPSLPRKADLVFPGQRIAVFVDGCFWHGCPEHGRRRHTVNAWYWPAKIEMNVRRDAETDAFLRSAEWLPIRVWEHADAEQAAAFIASEVRRRRARLQRQPRKAGPGKAEGSP